MPATVIAERVQWTVSISWFRERIRAIRPEYQPADPVDRLEHPPGRVIQCDLWFPEPRIPIGFGQEAMLPVLVLVMEMVFSRFIAAVMRPSRQTMDLVAGMRQLLTGSFAAVPDELWWDNEAGIGRRGRLTDPVTALMGTPGSWMVQLKPYDPASTRGPRCDRPTRRRGGYIPFELDAANLLFQLVSSCYEHASLILPSNLPFARWADVFGDQVVAAAMIDRIVHHAAVLTLKGASYRLKDTVIDTLPSARADNAAQ